MKKIMPIIVTIILIIFDQITKYLTVTLLKPIETTQIIDSFICSFSLTYVENRGAAFGILSGARWLFIIITIIVTIVCIYYYTKIPQNKAVIISKASIILIISGAIGNMIDRMFRGFVVDMLHFSFFGKDFAVFNFADIFVCIGVFFTVIIIICEDKNKEKNIGNS